MTPDNIFLFLHYYSVRVRGGGYLLKASCQGTSYDYLQYSVPGEIKKKKKNVNTFRLKKSFIWSYGDILLTCPSLRKHAYSNILKNSPPKNENFQMKNSGSFHISAQNINCGNRLAGGSNEYPQSMFFEQKLEKIMYIPVNPSCTI